ncbi:rhomboid-related protein 2-like [Bradysia coprophila]|uniref:rhomboid-related protein 2-like n=1 Tax=Bradysia coprophila TaxID=38358 RepID=UPI00187D7D15|nr:rhomboid-related protein 2-like [Bradysia coprophila]
MENKSDEVVAGQVVSQWRRLARQQSTRIVKLADNIVLPRNERTSRQIPKNVIMEMNSVESQHPPAAVFPDKGITAMKTEKFPKFMIGVSVVQIFLFCFYDSDELIMRLGYDPSRRHEVWRFFTPIFVHIGWSHLLGNLVMQLILGVFLEIVHEWRRIAIIYLASGFGAALCVTVLANTSYGGGASGAVMGLLFSHLATIVLNWNEMERKFLALYIIYDVGRDVYTEVYLDIRSNIGHAAHFGGAVTGFLVSILVLKNFKKHPWEETLQKICVGALLAIFVIILAMNVTLPDYFPENEWNFDYAKTYYREDSAEDTEDYLDTYTEQSSTMQYDEDYHYDFTPRSTTTPYDEDYY